MRITAAVGVLGLVLGAGCESHKDREARELAADIKEATEFIEANRAAAEPRLAAFEALRKQAKAPPAVCDLRGQLQKAISAALKKALAKTAK